MKKKAAMLIGLAAAILILLAVYAGAKRNNADKPAEDPDINTASSGEYKLIACDPADLSKIEVTNENGDIVFDISNEGITVQGADMALLDDEKVVLEINSLTRISSDNEVEKGNDGQYMDKYGIGPDVSSAEIKYSFADGSEKSISLGDITPDGQYYYAASENNVYTIGKTVGDTVKQGVTDLAELDMDLIDPNAVAMLEVRQKDRDDLRISFEKENELSNDQLDKSGLQTLVMHSPIENILVYPYNLETGLLYNYDSFVLEKMVEIGDENFDKYGLADPVMSIAMADTEESVTLKVGNKTEDGASFYVTPYGNKAVYTMPEKALQPFFDYEIIDFIQKFIALHYRYTLSGFDISSVYGDCKVEFKEEDGKTITEENGSVKDTRQEYVNGKPADSDKFAAYYELVVGLTFDALEEVQPSGEPQAEIAYHLLDGTEDTVRFYNYDDNFFVAVKDGNEGSLNMLITKQQVKQVVDKAKEF